MAGNCGLCHGPIEPHRGPGAAMCEVCAGLRYSKLKRAREANHGMKWKSEKSEALMREGETALPEDTYARTHAPISEEQVEEQARALRMMLDSFPRTPRSSSGWAGVRRNLEGLAWASRQLRTTGK